MDTENLNEFSRAVLFQSINFLSSKADDEVKTSSSCAYLRALMELKCESINYAHTAAINYKL